MQISVRSKPRRVVAGISVGILTLDTRHELVLGNIQHAQSFDFPVMYSVVRDVPFADLMRGDASVLPKLLQCIEELETAGAEVIVGACGSFAHYQKEIARAISLPVCLSILVQTPFVLSVTPYTQKLGIVFARDTAFTAKAMEQCDITSLDRIVTLSAADVDAFRPVLDYSLPFDSKLLERELIGLLLERQKATPEIGAWMLQCSDLPPYARAIKLATGLPVFDMRSLIKHLHDVVAVTRDVHARGVL